MILIEHLNKVIGDEKILSENLNARVIKDVNPYLPNDFIEFYCEFGNSDVIIGTLIKKGEGFAFDWFYPLNEGIDPIYSVIEDYEGRMPTWLIPFAPDYMGNQFVISVREKDHGSIYLWEQDYEYDEDHDDCSLDEYEDNLIKIADSFSEFILSMVKHPED